MDFTELHSGLHQVLQHLPQGPLKALAGPVATLFLRVWIARLVALGILRWGTTWVPTVVEEYRAKYFTEDFPTPHRRGFAKRWLWLWLQALAVYLAGYGLAPEVLPCLALMAVALQGVISSDRRFQVIPDRFQLVGALGALGFAALQWAPPGVSPLTVGIAAFPVPQIVGGALKGVGIAALLWAFGWLYGRVRRREAMGLGDIKLLAWLGLALGADTLVVLVYSLIAAALLTVPLWLIRSKRLERTFAFGPYIVVGCLVHGMVVAYGEAHAWLSFVTSLGGHGA